ncbi:metal dependent phosphohydrolase [Denitrovibrio acetiphilus DSM 12809]|uniref:Metal dependent phosphohydrolase n=1 Tax=Denitrovibrio acetiphilus (strain DSM 12809 / NBRC 114555 / N2460) TaxID=522772 RepID=D4H7E3_DENA2|nr:HDIG domain-containing metalloprotein [Denitrovibrio acetiphilus]ADD67942.1 metal dependent phosphohydrolase [Denitrovibrio acetiphilus DSM 12809]
MELTRKNAYTLLTEYTKNDSLLKHALSVEQAMKAYAAKYGADAERWGIAGLLHDFDYEMYPSLEDHPFKGVEILKEKGYPQDIIDAVAGHAEHTGVKRETMMAKTLFAVDELCGFLLACAYVRPDKSIANVQVKSVKKKLKDKSFARAVNRDDIEQGIAEMELDKDEHIKFVIDALAEIGEQLGV